MNKWKHFLHKINRPIWWVSCKLVLEMSNRFLTFLCKSRRWTLHVNEGSSLFKMIQIFLFVRCTTDSAVVVYVSNGSDEYQLLGGTQFRYVHAIKITDDKFPNIIRHRTSLSAALSYSSNWCSRKRNSWQKWICETEKPKWSPAMNYVHAQCYDEWIEWCLAAEGPWLWIPLISRKK